MPAKHTPEARRVTAQTNDWMNAACTRIIAEATAVLSDEAAQQVEERVLAAAGEVGE